MAVLCLRGGDWRLRGRPSMPPTPPKRKIVSVPDWLPDPSKATETVNVHKLGEMLLATVKKGLGIDFAS